MAMSKLRPIFTQAPVTALSIMYPPYGKTFNRIINLMLRF
jgi:coniferyl-aldehyde dehydrogenase